MIRYSIDNIQYTNNGSCFHIACKGWVLSKDYTIIVRSNGEEVYHFQGNEKRYDICIACNIEITEDDYGFEVEFDVPLQTKMIILYALVDGKENRLYSLALDQSKHHHETLNNVLDSIKRSIVTNLDENHSLPLGKMFKGFIKMLKGETHDRIFDPSKKDEYHEWLKLQKYTNKKNHLESITVICQNKEFKSSQLKVRYMDTLDLNEIHTEYVCFVGKECDFYKQMYSYLLECEKYDVLYFDNDSLDDRNERVLPQFKPDFSYDTLHSINYIGHVFVVKKSLLKQFDQTKIDLYQYLLELSNQTNDFGHISKVLYLDLEKNEKNDVEDVLRLRPMISIIIPTKDHIDDLDKCLTSIYSQSSYNNFEIIVVNNNSEEKETFEYLKNIRKTCPDLKVIDLNCEFNFSYLNNYPVKNIAKGEYILMLNNDTEVVTNDWLENMLIYAMKDGVGSVGAYLMFPDDTIQHAGILMGKGGVAGHVYSGKSIDIKGYGYELSYPYNVSCCTAACLMCKKDKYLEVGGLNEELKVAFNDVDFGLKLLKAGYRNVFLPSVKLYHYESKSRGMDKSAAQLKRYYEECDYMKDNWNEYIENDPFYNDNYSLESDYHLHD